MSATTQDIAWQDVPAYHTPESVRREFLPEGHLVRSPLLDKPTDPHPLLNLLMDEALTRILLVSDGAVMALRERITSSHAGTIAPSSDLAALLDQLGSAYQKCKTHRARLKVIKEAQTTADRLRFAPRRPKSEQRGTREWKEVIGNDQRPCRIVASVYGISLRDVVAYRKAFRVTKVAA